MILNNEKTLILENDFVKLRPIHKNDIAQFYALTCEMNWEYFPQSLSSISKLEEWYSFLQRKMKSEHWYSFSVILKKKSQIVGSTSYMNVNMYDRRVEIGWSWLGLAYQGMGINKHCKYLLLRHAIEKLGIKRVEFKVDSRNHKSLRALANIGATAEGTLRSYSITSTGSRRDASFFSILSSEWDEIRQKHFSQLY